MEQFLNGQDPNKKLGIFKQAVMFQEKAAGVIVQKVPAIYLKRLMNDANKEADPLVRVLQKSNVIFKKCHMNDTIDMASSLESIVAEYKVDRAKGNGHVFIAWKMPFHQGDKKFTKPVCVGMATVYNFKESDNFSTTPAMMSDYGRLRGYMDAGYLYMDSMCVLPEHPGVGTILVMNAYQYAMQRKLNGLIALSYSNSKKKTPASKRLFEKLEFQKIKVAAFRQENLNGIWFVKEMGLNDFAGFNTDALDVCTRKQFSSPGKAMPRC